MGKTVIASLFLFSLLPIPLLGQAPTCAAVGGAMLDACETLPGYICPTKQECDRGWRVASPSSRIKNAVPSKWIRNHDGSLSLEICVHVPPSGGIWRGVICPSIIPKEVSLLEWCRMVDSLPVPPPIPGIVNRPLPKDALLYVCGM